MPRTSPRPGRLSERFAPTALGLPSAAALCWFPLLVVVVFIVLVALNLNGSSSAQEWSWFHAGSDPGTLLGESRPVRSDEWFVQLSWTISQFYQDFPVVNPSLPGGTDLTTLYDVPTGYWTIVFRPQLWGYFFLGLSHGLAWHWWLPAALTMIAAYLLVITLNPKRPLTAAALAGATVLTPMMLWWWQTSVFLSVGWALFAITAMIWIVKDPRLSVRLWWILAAGFFAANLALSSYIPFILSGVWVFIVCSVGVLVDALRDREISPRVLLRRVGGLVLAGAGAGVVMLSYAYLRRDSLQAIVDTLYPGARSDPTGALASNGALSLFAAPFNGALRSLSSETALGGNQSESATSFMVAIFLVPGLAFLIVAARRSSGRWSWTAICVLAATGLYVAYLFIAHWDLGARILMLDKVPAARARLAFAALLPVSAAVTIQLTDRVAAKARWIAASLSGIAVVVGSVVVWLDLRGAVPNVLAADSSWRIAVLLMCAGTVAVFFRRLALPGALALLGAAVVVSAGIIPIQRGVVDLHNSAPGRAVRAVDASAEGTWVGTQFPVTTAVLVQSGVRTLNGVQSYPSLPLWHAIDPTDSREINWNRLAHLDWRLDTTGETREELVAPDHLVISMDPCSAFAQKEVDYVLMPVGSTPSPACLRPVRTIDTPAIDLQIMRIVPAGAR
jgi:hypothetical protein